MLKKLLLSLVLVMSMCVQAKPDISAENCELLYIAAFNAKGFSNMKMPITPLIEDIEKDTEMSNSSKSNLIAALRYGYYFPDENTVAELQSEIIQFCKFLRT